MKYALILSIFAALLGGCAIVPAGYADRHDGYYQGRGYYQERDYYRGERYGRDYEYRQQYDNAADPFRQHGH
jgi:hypothetical protein